MNIEIAKQIADLVRPQNPEMAARIDALIAAAEARGQSDGLKLNVSIGYKLEKFDGEYEPGKKPVEVIEGRDVM